MGNGKEKKASFVKEINTLKLFNEKATKLSESAFNKFLKANERISVTFAHGDVIKEYPDQTAIDALVLTLRLFCQDNEQISIRNISEVYRRLPISPNLKHSFESVRLQLNNFLERTSNFTERKSENECTFPYTNRMILEIFLYGDLAHTTPEKRIIYKKWKGRFGFEEYEALFCYVLGTVVHGISLMADINKKALEELS